MSIFTSIRTARLKTSCLPGQYVNTCQKCYMHMHVCYRSAFASRQLWCFFKLLTRYYIQWSIHLLCSVWCYHIHIEYKKTTSKKVGSSATYPWKWCAIQIKSSHICSFRLQCRKNHIIGVTRMWRLWHWIMMNI